jgi:hypothetical protein
VSARTKWITGLVAGGAVGFLLYKLLKLRRDERPPIRVRGGSVHLETDCGWIEAGSNEWRQDLAAPPVRGFIVTVYQGSSTRVFTGQTVHINQGAEMLTLSIDVNGEPKVGPRGRLAKDPGNGGRVTDPAATLSRVHVIPGNQPLNLSDRDRLEITYD